MSRFKIGALIVPLLMAATLASADVRVYLHAGPPRANVEIRTARPDRDHFWVSGYHRWDGSAYGWVPGEWQMRPRPNARWRDGRWRRDRHQGWYWTEGAWR